MTQEEVMAANYAMLRQRDLDMERAAAEAIAREKAKLRDKALPTLLNTVSSDFIHIDENDMLVDGRRPSISTKSRMRKEMLSVGSEERDALQTSLRDSKKEKRQKAKIDADSDQKWMIFRDLDAFDEADMVKVARFMETVLKVHEKLPEKRDGQFADTSRVLFDEKKPYSSDARPEEDSLSLTIPTSLDSTTGEDVGPTLTEQAQKRLRNNSIDIRDTDASPSPTKGSRGTSMHQSSSPSRASIQVDRSMSTGTIDISLLARGGDGVSNAGALASGTKDRGASTDASQPMDKSTNMVAIQLDRKNTDPLSLSNTFPPKPPQAQPSSPQSATSGRRSNLLDTKDQAASRKLGDLLRKGVVITPTTALNVVGTRATRSPSMSSQDGGNSDDGRGGGSAAQGSAKAALSESGVAGKPTAPVFDLYNFDLPSGFVTAGVAKSIIDVYKQGGRLSIRAVHKLLRLCYRSFKTLANTSALQVGADDRMTIVGDIHGQLTDLLYILDHSGLPSKHNKYIFNGDFVDRGPMGVEVMCVMMSLYLGNPGQVVMNRGNHEDFAICCVYGFQQECCTKYDEITFGMFVEVFNWLPLFATINDSIFVLHGGLFHNKDVTLKELDCIKRTEFSLKDMPESGESLEEARRDEKEEFYKQLQRDALWSDPSTTDGLAVSNRGAGVMFGPDVTRAFCRLNDIKMIVRSHECCRSGFELPYSNCVDEGDKNLIATIFSASDYGGGGNSAAYMVFTHIEHTLEEADESPEDVGAEGDSADKHYRTPKTRVSGTNLQYEVHYFAIDFQEEEIFESMSAASYSDNASVDSSSGVSLTGDLSIHELVLRKKHLLLNAFELADYKEEGEVSVPVWADVMHKVLSLHINWENMVDVLVSEDCIRRKEASAPPTPGRSSHDGAQTDDEDALSASTHSKTRSCDFIDYRRFLDTFSLSLEVSDGETLGGSDIADSQGSDFPGGESAAGGKRKNRQQSVTGKLVDSLYAHHHELLAIFRFFDVKKDNVISKEEFRDGMRIIRKMNKEAETEGCVRTEEDSATAAADEAEFNSECDMLLEIMNLNGSGFIDINDFLEMFRVSDAMKRKMQQGAKDSALQGVGVSTKVSSGPPRRTSIKAVPPPDERRDALGSTAAGPTRIHGSVIHGE